ncbi:MAG: hypothetical protein LBU99_05450, partial [Spirochaetaceae bacterium]|nr:hypothetical protein [Spirochaetaceae bacterium]
MFCRCIARSVFLFILCTSFWVFGVSYLWAYPGIPAFQKKTVQPRQLDAEIALEIIRESYPADVAG